MTEKKTTALAPKAPDYLKEYEPEGSEVIGESSQIPRLKVLQDQNQSEEIEALSRAHGVGATVLRPQELLVALPGDVFTAVPVFAYVSFEKWRDIKDKGHATPVIGRTTDKKSALAKLCRNPATRKVAYKENDEWFYKHVESINFMLAITSGPAEGELGEFAFSRGGYKAGNNLRDFIKRQAKDNQVPIYAHRLEFFTDLKRGDDGKWMQMFHRVPTNPYAPKAMLPRMKELFDGFKEMHTAKFFDQVVVESPTGDEDG
jgi:hypothetical protein